MIGKYNTFMSVYHNKSFSKAAVELHMTQPAVSYIIKELENQLNIQLFHRVHQGVLPTEEGIELYKYINEAINIVKLGEQRLKEFADLKKGVIRIGTPSHIGVYLLNKYICLFNKRHSNIKFHIVCRSVSEMTTMLEMKSLDLVIEVNDIYRKKRNSLITTEKLQDLHYCFIVHSNFLKKMKKFPTCMEDICEYNFILPNETAPVRKVLNEIISKKELYLESLIDVWTSEMILDLVKREIGIGYFIQEFVVPEYQVETIVFKELPKAVLQISYMEAFQSMASKKFISFLKKEVKSNGKKIIFI